jgi:uncharacterized phosphosugar-binding protein
MSERYFEVVDRLLARVREVNRDSTASAAGIIADTVAADGIVRAFGSGHSGLLARDLYDRAGGLACVDPIEDPGRGRAENLAGYAATLLHEDQLWPPDCLIVISSSGRNIAPIELAMIARERGVPVIAATSVEFSLAVPSRHPSGTRLLDVADVVLDTCVPVGDAGLAIDGAPTDVGPMSTVLGAAVLTAVMVEATEELLRRGVTPPLFASQNVEGVDDYNDALNDRYRGRIRALP